MIAIYYSSSQFRAFHWTYVSVVYSDTDYGNKGYDQLQELAQYHNICFSNPQAINVDHFTDTDYDTVIKNLMHKINARGIQYKVLKLFI